MKKIYVLDTNICMSSYGEAIRGFDDNDVVITTTTLEELDYHKESKNAEKAYEARCAGRILDEIIGDVDNVESGVQMSNGGLLRIEPNGQDRALLPAGMDLDKPDNRIISSAKYISLHNLRVPVILVTNDRYMKIKAKAAGVKVQSYHNDELDDDTVYTGRCELVVPEKMIADIYINKSLPVNRRSKMFKELEQNEFVMLKNECNEKQTALAMFRNNALVLINDSDYMLEHLIPKNVGQKYALTALLSDDFPLVLLSGVAGSGKTLLSVAAAMDGVFGANPKYDYLMYTRNNVLFDEEIGALPGDEQAKMNPLVRPFFDALEKYFKFKGEEQANIPKIIDDLIYQGFIRIESMAFMRGRSLSDCVLIVDEIQNATPKQMRGICTRMNDGTKLMLLGDPSQIDNNYLSPRNNGLTFVSQKMRGCELFAQMAFNESSECQRGKLASAAIERLVL